MRQFQLVPSGCQGWFSRVVGGGGGHFAYASTLAVYVYRVADYSLSSVLTGHQRTITGLSWSVANPRFFATSGADLKLVMWDAHLGQQVLSRMLTSNAFVVEFSPLAPHLVAFACEDKWVGVWDTRENSVTRVCQSGKSSARCVRWNERREGLLAIGCKNGQILLHNMSTRKTRELVAGGTEASPVADLRWDRLSEDYLLAAFRDGTLALYDVERGTQVQRFEKQGASVTALEWLPWQPGSFASINGRAGVVRIWNVSQRAPLEVVQVSDRPAWGMSLLPGTTRLLLSFLDGAVAVFDLATRSLRHRGLPGHIETIFDAQFHPTDPDTLATASYDASVKVWHAPSMRCAQTLTGNTGPLYSLCWSPDGSRIAASSGKGRVVVWDVCTGAVIMLKDDAHASTSLRVSWSRTDPDLLASVGMDKVVVLWSVSDKVAKQRVNHPNDVMGCDWCPVTPGRLATACADGKVRVYFLAPVGPRLDFEFDAHVGRAFNVAFSPLVPQLLASGGDDGRVVVHHLGKGTSTKLIGHTDKGEGFATRCARGPSARSIAALALAHQCLLPRALPQHPLRRCLCLHVWPFKPSASVWLASPFPPTSPSPPPPLRRPNRAPCRSPRALLAPRASQGPSLRRVGRSHLRFRRGRRHLHCAPFSPPGGRVRALHPPSAPLHSGFVVERHVPPLLGHSRPERWRPPARAQGALRPLRPPGHEKRRSCRIHGVQPGRSVRGRIRGGGGGHRGGHRRGGGWGRSVVRARRVRLPGASAGQGLRRSRRPLLRRRRRV